MNSTIRLGGSTALRLPFREIRDSILLWRHRHESRHQLLRLDDHLLRDIGLDRQGAIEEANKPFWRG